MSKDQQFLPLDLSPQACRAAVEESLRDLQALIHSGAFLHLLVVLSTQNSASHGMKQANSSRGLQPGFLCQECLYFDVQVATPRLTVTPIMST